MLDKFLHTERIAYFSMEIALCNEIPTYAGGLGGWPATRCAGAADLELPLVTISLVSHAG